MALEDYIGKFDPKELKHFERLNKYLIYEFSFSSSLIFYYVLPGIILPIIILASIAFVPYVLYVFIKYKRIMLLITFVCVVIIPTILAFILTEKFNIPHYINAFIIAFFILYFIIIKVPVKERVNELLSRKEMILQMKIRKEQQKYDNMITLR